MFESLLSLLPPPAPFEAAARGQGVAVLGAGRIVEVVHLPAYRHAGLQVLGVYDLAVRHGLARVYESVQDALDDEQVRVVDIAVPPEAQMALALRSILAGKHVLCQKPLALSAQQAAELVAAAQAAGVLLAVNQQMRFSEAMRVVRAMTAQGWVTRPRRISRQCCH